MSEIINYAGRIGEIVSIEQPDGRMFERFRRPPGTRIIVISPENNILVTKEYRHETDSIDLRLPGGKVRDSLVEYKELLASDQSITEAAIEAAKLEALQETGLLIDDLELVEVANAGATVEWDLYYFTTRNFKDNPAGQELEVGEDIQVTWMTIDELVQAIANGDMSEWRSVGVLLGKVIPDILNK